MVGMEGNVRVNCAQCGTTIVVMPPEVYRAINDTFGGIEDEIAFTRKLTQDRTVTGDRLAIGDPRRSYACPECGRRDRLPPAVELWVAP